MPGPNDSLLLILAALAACVAIVLLLLGLRKRPTRKTPHCPRCQYNLAGLIYEQATKTNPTCPECGYTATAPRQLLRLRRRRGIIALALLCFAVALACYQWPEVRTQGQWGFVPLTIRVALCRAVGTQAIPDLTDSLVDALQHSARLRSWHIRWLAQANPPAIIVPDAWLPGIPLRLGINDSRFVLIPVNIDPSGTTTPSTAQLVPVYDGIPTGSYIDRPFGPISPVLLATSTPGRVTSQLQAEAVGILNLARRDAPATPFQFIIPLRDSLDQIKAPIDTQTAADTLQAIAPRLVQQPPAGSWGVVTSFADANKSLPQSTVIALRLTILRNGQPIAEARWSQRPGESLTIMGRPAPLIVPGAKLLERYPYTPPTLATLLNLDPNDTTLTVRITTDEELVLCDFTATHYWRGDVTLPISALFARTP